MQINFNLGLWRHIFVVGSVGLAYSESNFFAACPAGPCDKGHVSGGGCACQFGATNQSGAGDHSNGGGGPDLTLTTGPASPGGSFTPPIAQLRGGFRYLNLFLESGATEVEIAAVSLAFVAAPTAGADPSAYSNYFNSSDELLNRIWYGCAYTTQLCSIDPAHGRQWTAPETGWNNGVVIGSGSTLLVDGAKRDRTIWPGDMGVSVATALATLGEANSSINSLETLYALQSPSGMLPYVGPEVYCKKPWPEAKGKACDEQSHNSDMYHLWALIGTANVFRHTGDRGWLDQIWTGYTKGVMASLRKVSNTGLMVVDQNADWARQGQGGENIAANALLYGVLSDAAALGKAAGKPTATFEAAKARLFAAINGPESKLWDESKGCFRDNPTSKIHPQDGNSIAVWFKATTPTRCASISTFLKGNWGKFGSASPEWGNDIGTFPGSMEVNAHASIGDTAHTQRAVDLIKLQWGYMINHPNGTQSTFWEGYHSDGSYAYQGIYMSHAHGWATGPASALSQRVLGLRPLGIQSATDAGDYAVEPTHSSLTFCSGSATFSGGRVELRWSADTANFTASRKFTLSLDASDAPRGSTARIGLPVPGALLEDSAPLALHMDGVGVVWTSLAGAAAQPDDTRSMLQGLDFSEVRVEAGRVRMEMLAARKLDLVLSHDSGSVL
eukprot:COSAG02_NODE_1362_length_13050_cov_22.164775_8_plen_671_part_00